MRTWDSYKKTMPIEDATHQLAREGQMEGLKALAQTAVALDRKNHKGHTPLMLACYYDHFEVAQFLLDLGCNPNSTDISASSILMGAAFKGHLSIVELLLRYGADPTYRNGKGQGALEYAQMFGRVEVVKFLKAQQNQPEVFSLLDILKGWTSNLTNLGVQK